MKLEDACPRIKFTCSLHGREQLQKGGTRSKIPVHLRLTSRSSDTQGSQIGMNESARHIRHARTLCRQRTEQTRNVLVTGKYEVVRHVNHGS